MNKKMLALVGLLCPLAIFALPIGQNGKVCISGVYPHLYTFNDEGECGTGAVVPWAGSLWAISYGPHCPVGGSDKLYEIKSDLTKVIRPESVGGTLANRIIHRESGNLLIGTYLINAEGKVRTVPIHMMPGRLTAAARHISDPKKIYVTDMEEALYELDPASGDTFTIIRDGHNDGDFSKFFTKHGVKPPKGWDSAEVSDLFGYHGKGTCSGFGKVFYANNGGYGERAQKDPTTPAGALAYWKEGDRQWSLIRTNQFTDISTRDGIYGNEHPYKNPIWALGWDSKSVILTVTTDGNTWTDYRLPKGSHSYDGAHGWNTEWPRIREIGEGDDFLMTMHGTFFKFPACFSPKSSRGILPLSNYLKIVGDFCRWGDYVVMGCDDTAANEFLNKRRAKGALGSPSQSNSNFWFVKPSDLTSFGPPIGRGAVWMNEDIKKGAVSDPYLNDGYAKRSLYLIGDGEFLLQVDRDGTGEWKTVREVEGDSDEAEMIDLSKINGAWVRLIAKENVRNVTAFFNYASLDNRSAKAPVWASGIASFADKADITGIMRSGKGGKNLSLEFCTADGYYKMDSSMKLIKVDNPAAEADVRKFFEMKKDTLLGDGYDKASAFIVDDFGKRWRFPYASEAYRGKQRAYNRRLCREVCTERDLINIAGSFFELPAENAGGFKCVRPVATHEMDIADYCTWRGLFVITGLSKNAQGERLVVSDDAKAGVWLGVADDLWKLGKVRGVGGPWNDTRVNAGVPSDPYLMTGYDLKRVRISADRETDITLEIDVTGNGTWVEFKDFDVEKGETITFDMSNIRAYWVRAVAEDDCVATVQFTYE